MKKQLKNKDFFVTREAQPDITGLIIKMQEQISGLEKKIDALIARPDDKPFERQYRPKPFQDFDRSHRQGGGRDNNYRERPLYKAICADCNKECEVPFRPSQDRPVYCKDCFSKRKGASSFRPGPDDRGHGERPSRARHFDRPQDGEKKKFYEKGKFFGKKRPSAKRRKARV